MFSVWKLIFPFMFLSLADGVEGGGGEIEEGGEEEIPVNDTDGVPFSKKYKEVSEKYKDIDLDKWGKVKDLDPDDYEEARTLREKLMADPEKFKKVIALLDAQEEESEEAEEKGGKEKGGDKIDRLLKEISDLKQRFVSKEEKEEADKLVGRQQTFMTKYRESIKTGLEEILKKDEFKDLEGLGDFENQMVSDFIDSVFDKDVKGAKKLKLVDVSRFLPEAIKQVKLQRAKYAERFFSKKRDGSPDPSRRSGNDNPGAKKKAMSDGEMVQAMVDDYKALQSSNIP